VRLRSLLFLGLFIASVAACERHASTTGTRSPRHTNERAKAEASFKIAKASFESEHDSAKAEANLRKAIEYDPSFGPACLYLSMLLANADRWEEARATLVKFRQLERMSDLSVDVQPLIERLDGLIALSNSPEWKRTVLCNRAIADAKAALHAKDAARALAASQDAIKIDSRRWEPYALASAAEYLQSHVEAGVNLLRDAIERAPANKKKALEASLKPTEDQLKGASLLAKANSELKDRNYAAAARDFGEAWKLMPHKPQIALRASAAAACAKKYTLSLDIAHKLRSANDAITRDKAARLVAQVKEIQATEEKLAAVDQKLRAFRHPQKVAYDTSVRSPVGSGSSTDRDTKFSGRWSGNLRLSVNPPDPSPLDATWTFVIDTSKHQVTCWRNNPVTPLIGNFTIQGDVLKLRGMGKAGTLKLQSGSRSATVSISGKDGNDRISLSGTIRK
jgi:hypothetical protein